MIRDIRIKSMISGTLNATLKHALISIETFGNSVSNSLGFFSPHFFASILKKKQLLVIFKSLSCLKMSWGVFYVLTRLYEFMWTQ